MVLPSVEPARRAWFEYVTPVPKGGTVWALVGAVAFVRVAADMQ